VSAAPVVAPPPALDFEDEDDDLPRPGKVWDNSGPSLKELLAQQQAARTVTESPSSQSPEAGVNAPAPASDAFVNVEPVAAQDLGQLWESLLDLMAAHGPALHSLLAGGTFAGVHDGNAVIRYAKKNETFTKLLDRNGKKDLVREGLSKILGRAVGVRFEVDPDDAGEPVAAVAASAAPQARPSAPSRPQPPVEPQAPAGPPAIRITDELIEEMRKDPLVASVMDQFNATPVKVE
jgi:hypothetical protein